MKMARLHPSRIKTLALLCLIQLLLFSFLSYAAVITVPGDYANIQTAINASTNGDEIIVSPGTYVENINFGGKNITLRSTEPTNPSVVASTVINGNNAGSVVTFSGSELTTCVLSGFIITNGYATQGGGICGDGSMATIENNNIIGNSTYGSYPYRRGGGIYKCNGTIRNNIISGNTARAGGGVYECGGSILNNTICGNSASSYGGGLHYCNGTILNNTIAGNTALYYGGGIYYSYGIIINCIIWDNSAPWNSQIAYSSTPFYSCVQDWTRGGRGNISADPKFADPLNENYHLVPDSPCIDTGYIYYLFGQYISDIDGECRIAGNSLDMGSDECESIRDSDGDLLADSDESVHSTAANNPDTDSDGLQDGIELLRGTNPTLADTPTGISVPAHYPSIQQALFFAFPCEEVVVSPSAYYENLHLLGKNVTLSSSDPRNDDIVSSTSIDGGGLYSTIFFTGSETNNCIIKGLTIRNGSSRYGAGIHGNKTLATLEHNRIMENSGSRGGGLYQCNGTIQNNIISSNTAYIGGALYDCDGTIQFNSIHSNTTGRDGGGLAWCDGIIQNNIISGNWATSENSYGMHHGGGLYECNGTIQNNIISGNSVGGDFGCGGGLYRCNGAIRNNTISDNSATAINESWGGGLYGCMGPIINCIIWGNSADTGSQLDTCNNPSYSCIQDWPGGGRGNIANDPRFVDGPNANYHLQADSPCIDAGNADYLFGEYLVDIDGECRLTGSSVDMGCDEYGSSIDSDGDLLADSDEGTQGSDPKNSDTDGDGLPDGLEVLRGTSPIMLNSPPGISVPADYSSIQQALLLAFPLEVVTISPGIYYENLYFMGKNIILQSTDPIDEHIVNTTIIDGSTSYPVISFEGKEEESCIVQGLTIRNGEAYYGGGIYGNGTKALIKSNKILYNSARQGGGLYSCSGTIQNNIISSNSLTGTSGYGGGFAYCNGTIQNNTISGNSAGYGYGGALSECEGTICNNLISGNSASRGGALYDCDGPINNNTISNNLARANGGGLAWCDGVISNNSISSNKSASWGGGLYDCNGTILKNAIFDNSAVGLGGAFYGCDGTIGNNIIFGNSATGGYGYGGGLYGCQGTIQNNIIACNSASKNGGGMSGCYRTIQNNTIYGNSAESGGGLSFCQGSIVNCIIWANSASTGAQLYNCSTPLYSCIEGWAGGGRGNISAGPRFVDPLNGNFHLQPDSPCIDGGHTHYLFGDYIADIDGECRLAGNSVDMGSDEYGSSPDSDGDLLADSDEATQGSTSSSPDTDGDGLHDGIEVLRGTSPVLHNTASGISIPAQFPSIQQGLFFAFPLEEITVSPGTYYENLHSLAKNVILKSTDPLAHDIVTRTVIDGGASSSVIFFTGTERETCVIKGLTIRNGSSPIGGGICGSGALATVENNKILGNSAYVSGGAIYWCGGTINYNTISGNYAHTGGGLYLCPGTIQNNTISDNSASYGGGLYDCDGTIQNNIIFDNTASFSGGGISRCDGTIESNTISGNSVTETYSDGGGLAWCDGTIQNNIIANNRANGSHSLGGGIFESNGIIQNNAIYGNFSNEFGGGIAFCSAAIRNCIIWGNSASQGAQLHGCRTPSYSCIQDWTDGGTGNISEDPQLVDPANGNLHLLPTSPCIDAGGYVEDLTKDFEGDLRPYDGTSELRGDGSDFDIGADEYAGAVLVKNYNFELTDEEWTSVTLSAYFTPPNYYYLLGHIILTAQDNTNTYGYWTSQPDAVTVIADCLYRTSWTVATDVTDPHAVPHMRLRVNSQNLQQADMLEVSSAGDSSYAPTLDGRTYEMYFLPPESCVGKPEDQDDLILSFDILNFDPADAPDASLMLDGVVVDAIPLSTLGTPTVLKTWNFESDAEGWQFGSVAPFFTAPASDTSGGALWLIAQDNTSTFGFWSGPSEEVQVEAGKLYRLRFTVSTDVTIQDEVPQLRLRASSEDFQASIAKVISSVTGAEMSPTSSGYTYDLYFYPPQSLVETEAGAILAAFDMLNFDPLDAPNGALLLDTVTVESLSVP